MHASFPLFYLSPPRSRRRVYISFLCWSSLELQITTAKAERMWSEMNGEEVEDLDR